MRAARRSSGEASAHTGDAGPERVQIEAAFGGQPITSALCSSDRNPRVAIIALDGTHPQVGSATDEVPLVSVTSAPSRAATVAAVLPPAPHRR